MHILQFFLPSLTALFVLLSAAVVLVARRASGRWLAVFAAAPVLVVVLSGWPLIRYAASLADGQRRAVLMGRYLEQALPQNAAVLSHLQSAALAHYARRPVVRFDLLAPGMLDEVVLDLKRWGHQPVLVLDETFEAPEFSARFAASAFARLDWAPRATARDSVSTLAYFVFDDRAAVPAPTRQTDVITEHR